MKRYSRGRELHSRYASTTATLAIIALVTFGGPSIAERPGSVSSGQSIAHARLAQSEIAATPGEDVLPFYQAPRELPAGDGSVIRSEDMAVYSSPLRWEALGHSQRVLYTSRSSTGKRIAVSGMILVPKKAWQGKGPQPVIGYAPGTRGWADRCAPSRHASKGLDYETMVYKQLLSRGYIVAVTDYEGLGTAGHHTYMMHDSEANSVTDVVRAALKLRVGKTTPQSPVAFFGYSQGGGASGAAVERAPQYAPELNLKGAAVGAPPSNLQRVAQQGDKGPLAGVLFGSIGAVALSSGKGHLLPELLNDLGMAKLNETMNSCVVDSLFTSAGADTRKYMKNGRTLHENLQVEPWKSINQTVMMGQHRPEAPVLLLSSRNDKVIPVGQVDELHNAWCKQGAHVTYRQKGSLTHLGTAFVYASEMVNYVADRVEGKKLPASTC